MTRGFAPERRRRDGQSLTRALCALALLAIGCGEAEREEAREEARIVREIVLDGAPSETPERGLFQPRSATVHDVVLAIDEAREEETVGGLFLRIGGLESAWARQRDLLEALAAFRAAEKPVHCYVETTDNVGYAFAARACDRISMTPAGMLDTVGVAAHAFFARSLLEAIGVRADVLQVGRFKGAAEPLTRDEMSPELRESMGALVDDLHADLINALVTGRHLSAERAQAILDEGPYDSASARSAGLVDDVAFDDEARTHAKRAARATRIERVRFGREGEEIDLEGIMRALSGEGGSQRPEGRRLALVHLEGTIVDEEDAGPGTGRSGPFVRHMRALAEDDEVRAVVLRIDSPGGSALASDRMWHAVRRCAAKKPVIVSLGDVAASGGYYIASAGTEILAHPTSTVGSIGVIGGKVDLSNLMDRIGISAEIIARGENAGWSSPTRGFTEREREVLLRSMRSTYGRFLRRVADGREMERARVAEIAEGRVWSGMRGLELGLVDQLGGLRAAIALARERGELEDDAPIDVWPRERGFFELIGEMLGGGEDQPAHALLEAARSIGPFGGAVDLAQALAGREHVLLVLPVVLEIR